MGIFVVDMGKRVLLDVNEAALRMIGYSRSELVGSSCHGILCDESEPCSLLFDEKGSVQVKAGFLSCRSGVRLPVLKTLVRASIDGRDCFIVSIMDITEQKRLEELRADVDRIVAHDLRAPIISVINGCRLLLMEEERVDGEIREMLELIEFHGKKAFKLIDLSLDLYKVETGTFEYVPDTVDGMTVVREVCGELDSLLRDRDVSVDLSLNGARDTGDLSLALPGNGLLMETMVANLLLNAIEAAPPRSRVEIDLASGDPVVMTLRNPGAVPMEIRDTFFDKYSTQGKRSGTGLGTYSASLAARAMGGDIRMDTSDEEDQTTVTVLLPGA